MAENQSRVIVWFKAIPEVTKAAVALRDFPCRWARGNRTMDAIRSAEYEIGGRTLVLAVLGEDLAPSFTYSAQPDGVERPILSTNRPTAVIEKKSESDTHLQLRIYSNDVEAPQERAFFEKRCGGEPLHWYCVDAIFEKPVDYGRILRLAAELSQSGFRVEIAERTFGIAENDAPH